MSQPRVRTATVDDAIEVARLYSAHFPEHIMVHKGLLNDPGYLREQFSHPDQRWMVQERDGHVLGVAALAFNKELDLGEIERVCVDTSVRGGGIAYKICGELVSTAREIDLGFLEAFARGRQPAMQRTFEKLDFRVHGIAPRYAIIPDQTIKREQFVHMCRVLKPETVIEEVDLIPAARELYEKIHRK